MTPPPNIAELTVDKGNLQEIVLRKELYGFVYFSVAKNNTRITLGGRKITGAPQNASQGSKAQLNNTTIPFLLGKFPLALWAVWNSLFVGKL